jgi:hypothetical protein
VYSWILKTVIFILKVVIIVCVCVCVVWMKTMKHDGNYSIY